MREIRLSGSEGGVALIAPSLPLSQPNCIVSAKGEGRKCDSPGRRPHIRLKPELDLE